MNNGPLDGLRVLDLSRVLAGPHCGRTLSDLGAEVIKIEPPDGDLTRFANPRVASLSTYFVQQNVGKRCISIDLATEEGGDILRRLADRSDVLLENYRPGVMDRLGLGPSTLMARNPRLVYASISGYGADGPWVHRRAYAPVVGVESGFTRMQGDARGGHYANDPWSHADTYTALETTVAILAALHRLERTGRGERIDVSMAETMLYVNEHAHDELYDGPVDPAWIRSFQPGDYPMLAVADGTQVLISGHPAERGTFELVIDAMDRTDLADDPRFVDVPARRRHFDELLDLMRAWAARFPDARTFEERCSRSGLAVGEMRTVRELADSDWADARGAIARIPDRDGGTLRIPNPPWHFSGATVGPRGTGRYRGEDNRAVLGEILGLDAATLDDLEARGILTSRVPKG